jgi:hypothetical protein
VLANSLSDVLALLAVGSRQIGMVPRWADLAKEPPPSNIDRYRTWAKSTFDIDVPQDPRAIVERARKDHPIFQEWIDAWKSGS